MNGLIIKKEWLHKIFCGGKWMEIRSSNTSKRGRIALIESGSGLIVGDTYLDRTMKFRNESHFAATRSIHQVPKTMPYRNTWAWCFAPGSSIKYDKPIPYKHPQGAIIWVRNVLLEGK